jgi:biopolymer transport protein ExbB/TolQ
MAREGAATLSAVAPGISGALLTTVVGLLVALPSAIGYNLLTNQIRWLTVQMDNFADEFDTALQRYYARDGGV